MTTPSGRWAALFPNPYLSPYPNNVPLFPDPGEVGFALYFCAPAVEPGVFLVFVSPLSAVVFGFPFVAMLPSFLYIPGQPVWCYLTTGLDLTVQGTWYVYLAKPGQRLSNNVPLVVGQPSSPPSFVPPPPSVFPGIFELGVSPLGGDRPLG